ncbi:MAG: TrkA C-terminal domain-containing protein [Chloroflexi bacterium]|nr:TrkA C-terminal domain-containing protein [Chloroflexota bacterium]
MVAFFLFLLTVSVSYIVVRIGAIALRITGLEWNAARFEALSAFSRTGFTTSEAEKVIDSPLRRRIIIWLIVLGNAGLVTVIITMVQTLHFRIKDDLIVQGIYFIVIIIIFGTFYRLLAHEVTSNRLDAYIERQLRRYAVFKKLDWRQIFHQQEGFGIVSVTLTDKNPLCGRTAMNSGLESFNIIIVAIQRPAKFIPTPGSTEIIRPGDMLICYGSLDNIDKEIVDKNNTTGEGEGPAAGLKDGGETGRP